MSTKAGRRTERLSFAYNLRTALEVVLVACVSMPLALLSGLILPDLLGLLVPFAIAFYYGYRRKRRLGFFYVLLGYVVFNIVLGHVFWWVYGRFPHPKLHHAAHVSPFMWLFWALWIVLPTLCTIWGQSWRIRKTRVH